MCEEQQIKHYLLLQEEKPVLTNAGFHVYADWLSYRRILKVARWAVTKSDFLWNHESRFLELQN